MSSVPQFPHVPPSSRNPGAHGLWKRNTPPASTPSSALSVPPMVVAAPGVQGAEGEGKSHHVSLGSDACLGGPNPARPCVGGSGGGGGVRFLARWRGCDSCPRLLPVGDVSCAP